MKAKGGEHTCCKQEFVGGALRVNEEKGAWKAVPEGVG